VVGQTALDHPPDTSIARIEWVLPARALRADSKEKCVASDQIPAINLLHLAERAVLSLLFLQSTRHLSEASSSFLHRLEQRATDQEIVMKRREFLKLSLGATAATSLSREVRAQASIKEIRIGYQKTGVLVIARQQAVLEKRFAGRQIGIKWIEFTSGPPLLEAMSIGSVDLGAVGDTPPIFAQAANANVLYVAGSRITNGQGILVPGSSGIRTIADLKGKRVGFTKGSSAHNVVIATLEKAGLTYDDITPVYLTPPDAGPAFANGSIEAWAVWDPYFAIGEKRQNGRILVNAHEVAKTNSFYLANRDFANNNVRETREVIEGLAEAARWAEANRGEVASALAAITGVPLEVQTVAANRASFLIGPVTDEIVTTQQAVADRFHRLGLIPKPIAVRDIVWRHTQS
jgi:sulfonate transport system substrate-binding protein